MSVTSNQYATKIFSQHPIACWPLDEDAYYVSLSKIDDLDIFSWNIDNGVVESDPTTPNQQSPFKNQSEYSKIEVDDYSLISSSGYVVEAESLPLFPLNKLNSDLKNFHLNVFIYQDCLFIDSYDIGVKYWDFSTSSEKIVFKNKNFPVIREWKTLSATIDNPDYQTISISASGLEDSNVITVLDASNLSPGVFVVGESIPQNTYIVSIVGNSVTISDNVSDDFSENLVFVPGVSAFIKFNLIEGGGNNEDYSFILHGLSVGQWSEQFCFKSLGIFDQQESLKFFLQNATTYEAFQYGKSTDKAYYVIEDNALIAKNEGIPMVFGSENVTRLYPSKYSNPSLVFPGEGMFSNSGKNNSYTLEFWLRIRPNNKKEIKIFGPLNSKDGLYVSEGFVTLSVNGMVKSFNVNEWYRPMLVNIVYSPGSYEMFINGENVLQLVFDLGFSSIEENNWLGFFGNTKIDVFEVDCISIFPYQVPLQVAKIRLIWGQGTDSEENIDNSFKGKPYSISFPNAKYDVNSIYPDKERWDAGYYRNLVANTKSISTPEYSLPEIFLSGRGLDLWYLDNKVVNDLEYPSNDHPKFITFRPNLNEQGTEWQADGPNWIEKCYFKFSNSTILSSPVSAFYSVFEINENISDDRMLVSFVNSLNGKRFDIKVSSYEVSYIFNGQEIFSFDASGQDHIMVGIHIPTVSEIFGYEISNFFSSFENLNVYVGGAPDTPDEIIKTFEGKIYKVSFMEEYAYEELQEHFSSQGIVDYTKDDLFIDHYSTYSMKPFDKFNSFFLDISISSYWEEYFPLTYFCKNIKDINDEEYYGFDFLQFNVGYPSILEKKTFIVDGEEWVNYLEFQDYYNYPISYDYSLLQNTIVSGFTDYQSLINNDYPATSYASSDSSLKAYATFQTMSNNVKEPLKTFAYEKYIQSNLLVDASIDQEIDPFLPYVTKYQLVDGAIIYPPTYIDIENIAIVIHFDVKQEMILKNKLIVRNMEFSSKALNHKQTNPIGTKSGRDLYPYTKTGIYYSYKEKNPIRIYKKDTPYLYLTENSGIQVIKFNQGIKERGVLIPVNEPRESNYYLGALQMFVKDESPPISYDGYPIFEIDNGDAIIEFFYKFDSTNKRKKIFAKNKNTQQDFNKIIFYQNGMQTENPVLYPDQWNAISVLFQDPINFSNRSGSINVFAGFTFNNISEYRPEGLVEIANIVPRSWLEVYTPDSGITFNDWRYWYNEDQSSAFQTWKDVLVNLGEESYGISPENIYEAYTGTNINVVDDGFGITMNNNDPSISIFSDIVWSSFSGKPS